MCQGLLCSYILIVFLIGSHTPMTVIGEFNSKEICEKSGKEIVYNLNDKGWSFDDSINFMCVGKQ